MHTEQNIWTSLSYRFFRAFEFCYTLLLDTVPGMTRMIIRRCVLLRFDSETRLAVHAGPAVLRLQPG